MGLSVRALFTKGARDKKTRKRDERQQEEEQKIKKS